MASSDLPRATEPSPTGQAVAPEIEGLPFERALAELEEIVKQLEGGRVPLEDSIVIYERGEALKRHCEGLLRRAEARIDRITLGPDGRPTGTTPFDAS